jgi:hypothetical protein
MAPDRTMVLTIIALAFTPADRAAVGFLPVVTNSKPNRVR